MILTSGARAGGPPNDMVKSSFFPRKSTTSASDSFVAAPLILESAYPTQ